MLILTANDREETGTDSRDHSCDKEICRNGQTVLTSCPRKDIMISTATLMFTHILFTATCMSIALPRSQFGTELTAHIMDKVRLHKKRKQGNQFPKQGSELRRFSALANHSARTQVPGGGYFSSFSPLKGNPWNAIISGCHGTVKHR